MGKTYTKWVTELPFNSTTFIYVTHLAYVRNASIIYMKY